jgi:nicotinamide-nucleotide amidase
LINQQLLKKVSNELIKNNITIATAESCTGGYLAHNLTNISGSSEFFERGVITYSNQSKIDILGVSEQSIKEYGAVSEQTAKEMAIGIKNNANVNLGISTTGIAGPSGGTKEKPVGLVFIGIAFKDKIKAKKFNFSGERFQIKVQTCNSALKTILENIIR